MATDRREYNKLKMREYREKQYEERDKPYIEKVARYYKQGYRIGFICRKYRLTPRRVRGMLRKKGLILE